MKVYIALADGFEIAEATLPLDILKRARVEVVTVAIGDSCNVTSSNGVTVMADGILPAADPSALADGDMLFLPGGMPGALNLAACEPLAAVIRRYHAEGKWLAAVCAAPMVFGQMGLLAGHEATCYPGFEEKLTGATFVRKTAVRSGQFLTGCGAGAGFALGHLMAAALVGEDTADAVLRQMMFNVYE